jgi:hypothetical protein
VVETWSLQRSELLSPSATLPSSLQQMPDLVELLPRTFVTLPHFNGRSRLNEPLLFLVVLGRTDCRLQVGSATDEN